MGNSGYVVIQVENKDIVFIKEKWRLSFDTWSKMPHLETVLYIIYKRTTLGNGIFFYDQCKSAFILHSFYTCELWENMYHLNGIWTKYKIGQWVKFRGTSCTDGLLLDIHTFDYRITAQSKSKRNSNTCLYIIFIL